MRTYIELMDIDFMMFYMILIGSKGQVWPGA